MKYVAEPVSYQSMEELDVIVEVKKDLSLAAKALQVPKKEMEDNKWLRRCSYENMVSQEVFSNLELKN